MKYDILKNNSYNKNFILLKTTIFVFIFSLCFDSFAKAPPESFADLSDKVSPAVVNIATSVAVKDSPPREIPNFPPGSPFEEFFKDFNERGPSRRPSTALGSGFIISDDGLIVTNNHVIEGAEEISVFLPDDREFIAKIIGRDTKTDLAVLKVDTKGEKLPFVNFGDSDILRVGDWVLAVGNPFGLGGTVTSGIVSARNRSIGLSRYEDYIQTDASINQGNSGGPLFNLDGDVIGINTAILGQSGSIGIGFAIPSNSAEKVIDQLIKFGETKRGWLGVRIQVVTNEIAESLKLDRPRGALVASVAKGSPSDKGGIKDGDVILEFDGKLINEMKELPKIVAETEVGKKVNVKIWRNKKEISKQIILGRLETSDDFAAQGIKPEVPKNSYIDELKITVRLLTKDEIAQRNLPPNTTGVVITDIDQDSPVNYLKVNNIIVEAQKKKIKTIGELNNFVKMAKRSSDKTLLIAIYNNQNQKRYIGVKLD